MQRQAWHGNGKGKQEPEKGKQRTRKQGKKGFHETEGHEDAQETQTGDHVDSWTDGDWWSSDHQCEHRFVYWPCMGTNGTTVATDATCSRTVQSNKGKGKQDQGKGEDKSSEGQCKSKNKGKGKQHGKKGKKGFHELEGDEDKQETYTGQ